MNSAVRPCCRPMSSGTLREPLSAGHSPTIGVTGPPPLSQKPTPLPPADQRPETAACGGNALALSIQRTG